MPSKTAVTELVRKKKETKQGKVRKRALRKKGTINFYDHFPVPAADDKRAQSK